MLLALCKWKIAAFFTNDGNSSIFVSKLLDQFGMGPQYGKSATNIITPQPVRQLSGTFLPLQSANCAAQMVALRWQVTKGVKIISQDRHAN